MTGDLIRREDAERGRRAGEDSERQGREGHLETRRRSAHLPAKDATDPWQSPEVGRAEWDGLPPTQSCHREQPC